MQPQLYNGARATVDISGQRVGAAFVTNWRIDTSGSEIETIDDVFPAEIAPDRIRVALDLQVYRHPDNDPVRDKIAPGTAQIGSTEQKGFTEALYFSIDVQDDNGITILHVPKAWLMSRSAGMSAEDFLVESWSIRGIGYLGPQS